jgi:hypothetical protein
MLKHHSDEDREREQRYEYGAQLGRQAARDQGLPEKLTDSVVADDIARLLCDPNDD